MQDHIYKQVSSFFNQYNNILSRERKVYIYHRRLKWLYIFFLQSRRTVFTLIALLITIIFAVHLTDIHLVMQCYRLLYHRI